ncbi:MAG: endolytic transglycosylase MltG [Acidimicrobiia bacterium]|nr:endolytic transglycosylase MltG [Acidimicrobiia bacterium]NNF09408.1 endolytic transglycosylase MltG [Acidimicrobiia bacterium]
MTTQTTEHVVVPQYDPIPPRRPFWVGPLVAIVVLVLGAWATVRVGTWAGDSIRPEVGTTVAAGLEVTVEIPSGSTARNIGALLVDAGVIASSVEFVDEVSVRDLTSALKAGSYDLITGMSIDEVLEELVRGPQGGATFRLTVIEGLWIDELIASLARQTEFTAEELTEPLLSGRVTSSLMPASFSGEQLGHWEGLLFPDTYEFFADATPDVIVGTLVGTMEDRVAAVDWSRLDELGFVDDPETATNEAIYDALIVASLVEAEAKLDDDRPLIASVIYNRLEINQGLNIDAALVYARGERGVPTDADKQIDSLYNTYRYAGLVPTPIGAIRRASLQAAADPAATNFYYYVVVDFDGRHGFSETLDEHNAKVAKARADGVI